jgi:hypothetical protein
MDNKVTDDILLNIETSKKLILGLIKYLKENKINDKEIK